MSVQAITWAYAQELPPAEKFLLVTLANYADADGYCFPGQERLAHDTGMGVRSIVRHMQYLELTLMIKRTLRRRSNGTRTSDGIIVLYQRAKVAPCKKTAENNQHAKLSPDKVAVH
jgi:Helix-turn-helix domain